MYDNRAVQLTGKVQQEHDEGLCDNAFTIGFKVDPPCGIHVELAVVGEVVVPHCQMKFIS